MRRRRRTRTTLLTPVRRRRRARRRGRTEGHSEGTSLATAVTVAKKRSWAEERLRRLKSAPRVPLAKPLWVARDALLERRKDHEHSGKHRRASPNLPEVIPTPATWTGPLG